MVFDEQVGVLDAVLSAGEHKLLGGNKRMNLIDLKLKTIF
jgi:hypothetical protein